MNEPGRVSAKQPQSAQSKGSWNSSPDWNRPGPSVGHCTFPRFYGTRTQIFARVSPCLTLLLSPEMGLPSN